MWEVSRDALFRVLSASCPTDVEYRLKHGSCSFTLYQGLETYELLPGYIQLTQGEILD